MNATFEQLKKDLQNLGVSAGDLLVVHSSFKSLGLVEGGAECVIAALKDVLGPEGTLVFPTFTYSTSYASSYFSNLETPSCVGYLSEFFRKTEGVIRTNHPTHSVAIYGKLQKELNEGVELTMNELIKIFTALGVEVFGNVGDEFDPNLHNAIMHTEDESFGENTISLVFQKGFKVGEKVVRFAMVQVAN